MSERLFDEIKKNLGISIDKINELVVGIDANGNCNAGVEQNNKLSTQNASKGNNQQTNNNNSNKM